MNNMHGLTEDELDELPIGSTVTDCDGDEYRKTEPPDGREDEIWAGNSHRVYDSTWPSAGLMAFAPVELRSRWVEAGA